MPLAANAAFSTPVHDPLPVTVFHRRAYKYSHTYLVTAADGEQYMLKAFPSQMAAELAFREICASELGTRFGFSMARWRVLQVDSQTCIEQASENQTAGLSIAGLSAGFYYGSAILKGTGQPRQYLTERLIRANPRIARELGRMIMFDVWLANADFRHFSAMVEDSYPTHVYFYGNSRTFCPENPASFDERVAEGYATACRTAGNVLHIHHLLASIRAFSDDELKQTVRSVPTLWWNLSLEIQTMKLLRFRRDQIMAAPRRMVLSPGQRPPTELLCDTNHERPVQPSGQLD